MRGFAVRLDFLRRAPRLLRARVSDARPDADGAHLRAQLPNGVHGVFDLASDPHERTNLANDPASAWLAGDFRREVAARWDLTALDCEVRQSQRRRIAVGEVLRGGTQAPWDFTPAYDASRRYIRNHMDLAELERMARFPPTERRAPLA